jgi:acyl-CoA synthetase (AMP-forming)/AMP-acid ligase II
VYGTTETSVLCTISKWVPLDSSVFLNIGKPFASSAWIVDPSDVNQIIPIGSVGELVLGGPTLAIGYLDQTAHANAFFTNPTWAGVDSTITQERYFRTGDLVRYVGNGDLELVGRT